MSLKVLTVTAEVASSSLVVPAILSKRLNSTFGRMAWYTRRCTLSDTFCGHRIFSQGQNHLHNFLLRAPLLATDSVRVDVHGDVAVGVAQEGLHRDWPGCVCEFSGLRANLRGGGWRAVILRAHRESLSAPRL